MKKHHLPFLVLTIFFFSCNAQNNYEWQIETATMAAPKDMREGAKVLGYNEAGELITLREGTNEITCLADDPSNNSFSVAAYHKDLDDFMARGRELRAAGKNRQDVFNARAADMKSGKIKIPQGSTLFILTGDYDEENDTINNQYLRYVVYIPFATSESTGLPLQAIGPGSPWIMDAGTHRAHIMINPPPN
ncbi:MAG: hypothetical protein GY816_09700 [Cytophagales bacterium]|nr:hypothetical protein [Cytophagales bacterium]